MTSVGCYILSWSLELSEQIQNIISSASVSVVGINSFPSTILLLYSFPHYSFEILSDYNYNPIVKYVLFVILTTVDHTLTASQQIKGEIQTMIQVKHRWFEGKILGNIWIHVCVNAIFKYKFQFIFYVFWIRRMWDLFINYLLIVTELILIIVPCRLLRLIVRGKWNF